MKNQRKPFSNLKIAMFATIVLVLMTMIVAFVVFRFFNTIADNTPVSTSYDRYYVLITDDYRSSFWESVYKGALNEAVENGAYVELFGSDLSKNYSKTELMNMAIDSDADGIILQADESDEINVLIHKAKAKDIPVVTVYGDCSQSDRISFVGVGSYNLGKEYGRQVLELKSQTEMEKPLKVSILINSDSRDSAQNILFAGIQEALAGEGNQILLEMVQVDDTSTFTVEESIRDILMGSELPDVIICLNEQNTICVYQAVVDYNLVGKVGILGYYDSDTILQGISRNVIYSSVSVDTDEMGRFCVEALDEYLESNNASQYYTADVTLINKRNVSSYINKENDNEEN